MELVYLWVENYKNIIGQGFNFSPRFRCEYDEEKNELTIDENKDYVSIFPDNINVTAIVGENGSGKSNLLDLILDSDGWNKTNRKSFFICFNSDTLVIYSLNIDINIKCNRKYLEEKIQRTENDSRVIKGISLNISFLTLSPFIHNINKIYSNSIDFQSIYNYVERVENKLFNFEKFFLSLIPEIPEILDNDYVKTFFNIKIKPKYLVFRINKYIETIYVNELNYILENSNKKNETDKTYLHTISLTESGTLEKIFELFYKIEEKKVEIENKLNELGNFQKNRRILNIHNNRAFNIVNTANDNKENRNNEEKEKLKKEILEIGEMEFYFAEEDLSENIFHFSTGELVLLFYIKKLQDINKKEDNLILLIDECELFLHPEWQKKFIYLLSDLFKHNNYKRQIILSSHSSFILSDLPKENIIFLEKGKQVYPFDDGKQTFGANIHTLLSHGFFMKNGLMGEFAKDKIDTAIKYLNQKVLTNDELDYCENIISIIGEPIIKRELQRMLKNKMELSNKTEIDKIREKVDKLTQELEQSTKRLEELEKKDEK